FNKKLESDNYLIRRHTTPEPRLTLGRELAKKRLVHSMIDISDGLILDLERLTTQNGLGAKIYIDRIPISSNYKKRIHDLSDNIYNLALSGGEDYELLFSSPKNKRKEIKNISRKLKTMITEIGQIAETPLIQILNKDGKEIKFAERGFVHFSS
ncbi:MAG: thiamine-monophosphate kinase, partial [Thermodesulfobacteriota bacterium]